MRHLRESAGLTLRAVAEEIGVSAPFLSDVEHNRRRTDKLVELARALGCEPGLLSRFDSRVPPDLKSWMDENPDVVNLLFDVKESGKPVAEIRRLLHLPTRRGRGE